jgi:4-aminobutyrate aminotransferase-like enzyme
VAARTYHDIYLETEYDKSHSMRKHYGPLLNGFYHIPFPDKYRGMYEQPQANSVEQYMLLRQQVHISQTFLLRVLNILLLN